MFLHRLVLFLTLGLAVVVLALNACSVVSGGTWIFRGDLQ